MTIGLQKGRVYLDEKLCFELWARLKSLQKVVDELTKQGVVHPESGLPPTKMGVQSAASRYMIKKPRASQDFLMSMADPEYNWVSEDNGRRFYRMILDRARFKNVLSQKKFKKLVSMYPYQQYVTAEDLEYANS